jgi:RNA polymerase sigma factor (sigma-70 family)
MDSSQDTEFNERWESLKGIAATVFHRFHIPINDEDAWQIARIALWYTMQRHKPELGRLTTYYYRVLMSHLSEYFASCHYGIQYPESLMRASKAVRDLRMREVQCLSLEAHFVDQEDDGVTTLGERLGIMTMDAVERRIALEEMMEILKRYLPPRQYEIICLRLGINGDPLSPKEIGETLGLSENTVAHSLYKGFAAIRRLIHKDVKIKEGLLDLVR